MQAIAPGRTLTTLCAAAARRAAACLLAGAAAGPAAWAAEGVPEAAALPRIVHVSVLPDGSQVRNGAYAPAISGNGRYVAFVTRSDEFFANDFNRDEDVYLKDLATGDVTLVSRSKRDTAGNAGSEYAAVSGDGRRIVFQSLSVNMVPGDANRSTDSFVFDTASGTMAMASITNDGTQASYASQPAISGNGRLVAFHTQGNDLAPGGDPSTGAFVMLKDLRSGEVRAVNLWPDGEPLNDAYAPSISHDGRFVTFTGAQPCPGATRCFATST